MKNMTGQDFDKNFLDSKHVLKVYFNQDFFIFKVEKILKSSLDSIPSPLPSEKFKLWAGKFASGVMAKHCWAFSTNFRKQKVC